MHTDPDVIALLSLGESVGTAEDHHHLAGCAGCRAQLAELTRVVQIAQQLEVDPIVMSDPPDRVWDAVRAELGLTTSPALPPAIAPPAVPPRAVPPPRTVIAPPPRRRAQVVLAAALALVAALGASVVAQQAGAPTAAPVIRAKMNALPRWAGSTGEAAVETDAAGNRFLVVTLSSPEKLTGKQEVWMSDILAEHMQAMGTLTDGKGRFLIPADVVLSESPVVDISAEPSPDPDPKHSGTSIVRCRLPV